MEVKNEWVCIKDHGSLVAGEQYHVVSGGWKYSHAGLLTEQGARDRKGKSVRYFIYWSRPPLANCHLTDFRTTNLFLYLKPYTVGMERKEKLKKINKKINSL